MGAAVQVTKRKTTGPAKAHLVSTRGDRERELAVVDEVLPELAKVEIRFDRSAAEEEQVLCAYTLRASATR